MSGKKSDWFKKHSKDQYVKQANKEGLRSRAAFKLKQIQEKERIFVPGLSVVDLGSAPGAWSELLVQWVGGSGTLVSCDLLVMSAIKGVSFVQGDFCTQDIQDEITALIGGPCDAIVSDMSPNLTGNRVVDQASMLTLVEHVYAFALSSLKPGGTLLMKVFHGHEFDQFRRLMQQSFQDVRVFKPKASRQESREVYLIAKEFKV